MKNKIQKYIPEIISIIIPIIFICISCLLTNTKPFGEYTLSKYDGLRQYSSFTIAFKNVLLGNNSIFYSFGGALGYNFYTTCIYYMFNPTNILCIFWNEENITSYYIFIILLRFSLSALTMCKYLKYKFKNQKNIFYIIFSVAYSLMGYNVCYYFNYMYFDNIVLFPILMIGLEKLIFENKNKLYISILTISILSNFYIGYMECIFCLLYFIYNYAILEQKNKKIIYNFFISSLLSGLITSIALIPEILDLLQGKLLHFQIEEQTNYFQFNNNFIYFFYKATPGSMIEYDIIYGSVNIYVSLLVVILVINYFFLKNISKKEKIITLIFILFFILSVSFNLIDYAWQMFQKPIWFPNRYIFAFSFFLIMIAAKTYSNIDKVKIKLLYKLIITLAYILIITYVTLTEGLFETTYGSIKICAYIFSIMLLILDVFLITNKKAQILVLAMFFIEILFNTIITFKEQETLNSFTHFQNNTLEKKEIVDYIKNIEKEEDNFYRINLEKTNVYTEGSFLNYNGIESFNSIKNSKIINFFSSFNYNIQTYTIINMAYNNPYITSLLGIKYLSATQKEDYYNKIYDKIPSLTLYKNDDALALGFMSNKGIYNYKYTENSYENTKNLANLLINDNMEIYDTLNDKIKLHNVKIKEKNNEKYLIIENLDDNYIIFEGIMEKDAFISSRNRETKKLNENIYFYTEIYINDSKIENYESIKTPLLLKKGDKYKIIIKSTKSKYKYSEIEKFLLYLNDYKKFISTLKENELQITNYKKDNYIEGTINVQKDKTVLFTTIPYDKGWKVYLDNKKVNYNICANAFICIDMDEGNHEIAFKFIPNGLIPGTIISILSLLLTVIYTNKKKHQNNYK